MQTVQPGILEDVTANGVKLLTAAFSKAFADWAARMFALVKKETPSEPDTVGEDLHKFFNLSTVAVITPGQFSEWFRTSRARWSLKSIGL